MEKHNCCPNIQGMLCQVTPYFATCLLVDVYNSTITILEKKKCFVQRITVITKCVQEKYDIYLE